MAGILKVDRVQSDSNLAFQVASSNVAYINSTGLNITGGEIIAGGSTLRTTSGLIYANNGIAFPSTMVASSNPNTLDDYEEGTFTATLNGSSANPATRLTTTGYYVKIGRHVTVCINYDNINTTGYSGDVTISGLPFVVSGIRFIGTGGHYAGLAYTGTLVTHFTATTVEYLGMPSAGGWSTATFHSPGAGRYFWAYAAYVTE